VAESGPDLIGTGRKQLVGLTTKDRTLFWKKARRFVADPNQTVAYDA